MLDCCLLTADATELDQFPVPPVRPFHLPSSMLSYTSYFHSDFLTRPGCEGTCVADSVMVNRIGHVE